MDGPGVRLSGEKEGVLQVQPGGKTQNTASLNIYMFLVSQLVMSSWDIRGFTLEANIDKLDDKNKCSSSVDTDPCTGDQLADSEKVGGLSAI